MGDGSYGIDLATVDRIADDVKAVVASGIQVCLVIGGGNIFRGLSGAAQGMDRASADQIGMLATVMNALAMQNIMENKGVATRGPATRSSPPTRRPPCARLRCAATRC